MSALSVKQAAKRTKKSSSSRKRRRNENSEINELASLVPWCGSPMTSSPVTADTSLVASGNGGGGGTKLPTMTVLRLTLNFLKLHDFVKDVSPADISSGNELSVCTGGANLGRMEEAIDGFLLILDKDANILYVSETIAGYVGLLQQDVIGQNLSDITDPKFSSDLAESLKPTLLLPSLEVDDLVVTQYRQFQVKFKPSVSYSTLPSHCITQVCGNLKVKLSTITMNGVTSVQPSVVGFVGECRVYDTFSSIPELPPARSSFVVTKSTDMKRVLSIEAAVKDVIGYDPEIILNRDHTIANFLHPADVPKVMASRQRVLRTGHGVGPRVRFLAGSGEWIWIQAEVNLRYKGRTKTPQYWEIKIRSLSRWEGKLTFVEQSRDQQLCPQAASVSNSHTLPVLTTCSQLDEFEALSSSRSDLDARVKPESFPVRESCGQLSRLSSEHVLEPPCTLGSESDESRANVLSSTVVPQRQSEETRLCVPFCDSSKPLKLSESATCSTNQLLPLQKEQSSDFDNASLMSGEVSPFSSTMSIASGLPQHSSPSQSSVDSPATSLITQFEPSPGTSSNADLAWSEVAWRDTHHDCSHQFQEDGLTMTPPSQQLVQTESLTTTMTTSDSVGDPHPVQMDFDPDQFLNSISSNRLKTELYSREGTTSLQGFRSDFSVPESNEISFGVGPSIDSIFMPSSVQSVSSLDSTLSPLNNFSPQVPSSFDFSSSLSTTGLSRPGLVSHLDDTNLPTYRPTHSQSANPWIDFSDPIVNRLFGDVDDDVMSGGIITGSRGGNENVDLSTLFPSASQVQNSVSFQNTAVRLQSQPRSDFVSRLQNTIYSCSSNHILRQFM